MYVCCKVKTYTAVTDIVLIASGSELCLVDERKIARNAAAVDVNWTRGRVVYVDPSACRDSRDSITWRDVTHFSEMRKGKDNASY